ncbi:MAG: hypothetical protein ACK5K7_06110 [Bacilli bacterium]
MKKIFVLVLSLFVFTGCGNTDLKKSSELVDSSVVGTSYDIPTEQTDFLDSYNSTIKSIAYVKCISLYESYITTFNEKVTKINASGGATGNVYTIGNETVDIFKDIGILLDSYSDFNADYVYGQLIIIRDNMKSIGFLD